MTDIWIIYLQTNSHRADEIVHCLIATNDDVVIVNVVVPWCTGTAFGSVCIAKPTQQVMCYMCKFYVRKHILVEIDCLSTFWLSRLTFSKTDLLCE